MKELQRAIESSLASASPLAQRIYANERWSAPSVQRFVNRVMAATVATVRDDGTPHAAVVLTACMKGTLHFTATIGSALLHNLERRPAIAMTVTDRDHDLTVVADGDRLGKASELPDIVRSLHRLSPRGQFTPRDWDGYLYVVRIQRIFLSR